MSAAAHLESPSDLTQEFERLFFYATEVRHELDARFRQHGTSDPRINLVDQLVGVIFAALVDLIQASEALAESDWWNEHGLGAALDHPEFARHLRHRYGALATASFTSFAYSIFESEVRRVARALDPKANSGGNVSFMRVYGRLRTLQGSSWTFSLGDSTAFVDLFRSFRNTLYNDGIFRPENLRDHTVVWRDERYHFVYGTVPPFASWPFQLMLLRDLVTLTRELMSSPMIAALPSLA